jgi:secreted trypsin-like serine protease
MATIKAPVVKRAIDKGAANGLKRGMLRSLLSAMLVCLSAVPASAMVGGAQPAPGATARHVVLIVGSRGTSCTATVVARDLLLTAAHCVLPGADYKLVLFDAARNPSLKDSTAVMRHPSFALKTLLAHRATADVALLKLAAPLPAPFAPARIGRGAPAVQPGDRFTVAGFGVTVRGDGKTGGTLRDVNLVATGKPGNLQLRLFDPATRNETNGLGACTGDSGAPVFDTRGGSSAVVGVVSWSTGAKNAAGCGGLTGVTPLALYRDWIADTARKLGSPLAE